MRFVAPNICNLMSDDEIGLGINRALHVVAHHIIAAAYRRRTGVRTGQRDLTVSGGGHLSLDPRQLHLGEQVTDNALI